MGFPSPPVTFGYLLLRRRNEWQYVKQKLYGKVPYAKVMDG
jgi:hypothetical protein